MPEISHSIRLTIAASYDELPLVRHVIRRVLPPLPDPSESLYLGAVTEILVNAIDATSAQTVTVTIVTRPGPAIVVSDAGPGFDPGSATSSKAGSLGKGLTIARAVVPGLSFVSSDHGTIVTIPYPQTSEIS